MRVATTIFTFGGGRKITGRHLPVWKKYSDDVLLVSPEDDPCEIPGVDMVFHEISNKFGLPCLKRQFFGMNTALRYEADYYVFTEYDGFMLKRPAPRPSIQANVFVEHGGRYQADYFAHFPWIFPAAVLKEFCAKASLDTFEDGFVDRWLAAQLTKLNLPVHDLQEAGEGYSRNSIESCKEIGELLKKIKGDAYALHGIKDEALFYSVLEAADQVELLPKSRKSKTRLMLERMLNPQKNRRS